MADTLRVIRDAAARREAMLAYAKAHDHFAELEQRCAGNKAPIEAEGAHTFALRALRAWIAEKDDPRPDGLPPCG